MLAFSFTNYFVSVLHLQGTSVRSDLIIITIMFKKKQTLFGFLDDTSSRIRTHNNYAIKTKARGYFYRTANCVIVTGPPKAEDILRSKIY